MSEPVSKYDDVFDIRDLIEEFEDLDGQVTEGETDDLDEDQFARFAVLKEFLGEVKGHGGDEQWRGDWYPVTFVRDSYFQTYAQELAEELDLIPDDARWPANCIDWEMATRELQQDYSSVEFDGVTYWYR